MVVVPTLSGTDAPGLTDTVRWGALVALGGLLVFAAGAKMMTGQWSQILIALFEVVVVVLLVFYRRSAMSWIGLGCLFGVFFGYTFTRWVSGAASCGCFGTIPVPPVVTLGIDAIGIVVAGMTGALHARRRSTLGVALSASFCCAGAGMVVSSVLSPPPPDHYSPDEETQLLASEPYSMLADADGPAWYVYLYDPDCPMCKMHLPRRQ